MDLACAAYGSVISVCVSVLKSIPFVKRYPKLVALALSVVMPLIQHVASLAAAGSDVKAITAQIVACVLAQFATAVAFHESVTHAVVG